jgi:hypothetical protein
MHIPFKCKVCREYGHFERFPQAKTSQLEEKNKEQSQQLKIKKTNVKAARTTHAQGQGNKSHAPTLNIQVHPKEGRLSIISFKK